MSFGLFKKRSQPLADESMPYHYSYGIWYGVLQVVIVLLSGLAGFGFFVLIDPFIQQFNTPDNLFFFVGGGAIGASVAMGIGCWMFCLILWTYFVRGRFGIYTMTKTLSEFCFVRYASQEQLQEFYQIYDIEYFRSQLGRWLILVTSVLLVGGLGLAYASATTYTRVTIDAIYQRGLGESQEVKYSFAEVEKIRFSIHSARKTGEETPRIYLYLRNGDSVNISFGESSKMKTFQDYNTLLTSIKAQGAVVENEWDGVSRLYNNDDYQYMELFYQLRSFK